MDSFFFRQKTLGPLYTNLYLCIVYLKLAFQLLKSAIDPFQSDFSTLIISKTIFL